VTEVGRDEFISRVVEKPRIPKSNFVLVGLYKIAHPDRLVESLEYIVRENIRTQNEFHLSDALMHLIRNGEKMITHEVDNWFDCGRKDTLLAANATLLNRPGFVSTDGSHIPVPSSSRPSALAATAPSPTPSSAPTASSAGPCSTTPSWAATPAYRG
jgi:glucose-1-phosphate thymidylyltransferase